MVFPNDIDVMIEKLTKSGVNVFDGFHVIYASRYTKFYGGVYPLKIVLVDEEDMPAETVCIISCQLNSNKKKEQ